VQARAWVMITALLSATAPAVAAGRVLDGSPIALNKAQTWCIAQSGPLPNWDGPGHPECKMVWRTLAEKGDRVLYSARYAWPSPRRSDQPLRVMSEVLFEGVRGSRVVRRLYAVQDDEAHVHLDPLRPQTIAGGFVIESRVCMADTGECGRELVAWTDGRVDAIDNVTVAEIRSRLPKGFDLKMNPEMDLRTMSGQGKAWAERDADCCPSGAVSFTLRLEDHALHVQDVKFERRGL